MLAICSSKREASASLFSLSLLASVFVGVACALGESTALGFLKNFPSKAMGYFSSGTGFAGISGALTLILLSAAGMSRMSIFILLTLT
mmetsp:Transcript_24652/g.30736  ORF Transcript_24652/g.30736 Transcript_24652/m.30736 type:complete len:88 (+) Transcript_24652:412-675(+)